MLKLADNLSLPPEISGRRTAIFGISGSGKSNTATVIIEGLLGAGEQVILIDPKGEGWGLLSLANGKPSNLDIVIFGEPNGHIEALNETHGPRLADFVFETGQSVVLSLLGFDTDQSERRFVATFLRHLYRRKTKQPKKSRTLVVFDEAHLFVPESSGRMSKGGDQPDLSAAVQRIARQGRTFGLGSLFVDQRPQDVSKRVISQVDTIICHQLTHKTDRAALSDWVKGYDTDGRGEVFLDSLASLQPGEAWVWSPSWMKLFQQNKVYLRRTYDSGAAPDDTLAAKSVQRADIDLEKLRGQLSEIIERAKADDPRELRKQIADLRKQLPVKPAAAVDQAKLETAVTGAVQSRDRHWQQVVKQLEREKSDLSKRLYKIAELVQVNGTAAVNAPVTNMRENMRNGSRHPAKPVYQPGKDNSPPPSRKPITNQVKENASPSRKRFTDNVNNCELGKCERAILQVLSQFPEGCDAGKLTLLAGYRLSGGFRNSLSALRSADLITGDNTGTMRITPVGEACGPFKPLPEGPALVDYWLNHRSLGKCDRAILAALLEHPDGLTAAEICVETGYELSGGFRNALSALRTAGLIVGRNTERMRPVETLVT